MINKLDFDHFTQAEAAELFRLMALEIEETAIFLMDLNGIIRFWNHAASVMKGYSEEEAVGSFFGMLYPEDGQAVGAPQRNLSLAAEHGYFREEGWRKRKDGSLFWARVAITALRDQDNTLVGFSKMTLDMTKQKELQECVEEKEEITRILDATRSGTWTWKPRKGELCVSSHLAGLLGYSPKAQSLDLAHWLTLIHPDERHSLASVFDTANIGEPLEPVLREVRVVRKDGNYRWLLLKALWCSDGEPPQENLHGVCVDIEDLKESEHARHLLSNQLKTEESRAQLTLQSIADGVITTDASGSVTAINAAAQRLTGWTERDATGKPASEVVNICISKSASDEDHEQAAVNPVAQCLDEGRTVVSQHNTTLTSRDGSRYTIDYSAAPIGADVPEPQGTVVVIHDITESKSLLDDLTHHANHDSLTGLFNRAEFSRRLQRALDRAKTHAEYQAALLYLDLDQFKVVNDTCGHQAGDDLLQQLAKQYERHVRERDTLARVGGDEFGLIIEHCTLEEAHAVAHKVLETTQSFRYQCKGQSFQVGVSIGLIPIHSATASVEEALRLADHACYIAKENGRNRIYMQKPGNVEVERRQTDMHWAARLSDAFHNGQLQLFAQPIRALRAQRRRAHYEVLLRLRDDNGGPIAPAVFLPAAERYDLMARVDRWVLSSTADWLSKRLGELDALDMCSLNVSQRGLADESFRSFAVELLSSSAIPADKLCFEISEAGALANLHNTITFMNQLKRLGCRFALDDFGTGMASFAYLKQIPVDFVKIDGSFVATMAHSEIDFEMVKFTNEISHLMGRQTIAEYVQDRATLRRLRHIGVDFAQGYLVGKPRPLG